MTTFEEKLIVTGHRTLMGTVPIRGAKNSVLKLMAASLLTSEPVHICNVPDISDVRIMIEVLRHLGAQVDFNQNTLHIQASQFSTHEAPNEFVTKMRASFNVLAPLLARGGQTKVALPGGCSIGKRGVDLHIKGLQALGAEVDIEHGCVVAKANKLVGADIVFDLPSVGATENVMVTAVLAEGKTTISNPAQEPEIIDLADFLNQMGAEIYGAGTNEITIHGVKANQLKGISHYEVVPDRIEAATYLIAGAATHGDVTVEHVRANHLQAALSKLTDMGAQISYPSPTSIRIQTPEPLSGQNITTLPYPGIPTDLQAPFMALATRCQGTSYIRETIYENRFTHVGQLIRMGAVIDQDGNTAMVTGVDALSGAAVKATDLRAGAALIIAGLMAEGDTEITNLSHLDRGYENFEAKFASLGAKICRITAEQSPVSNIELA